MDILFLVQKGSVNRTVKNRTPDLMTPESNGKLAKRVELVHLESGHLRQMTKR